MWSRNWSLMRSIAPTLHPPPQAPRVACSCHWCRSITPLSCLCQRSHLHPSLPSALHLFPPLLASGRSTAPVSCHRLFTTPTYCHAPLQPIAIPQTPNPKPQTPNPPLPMANLVRTLAHGVHCRRSYISHQPRCGNCMMLARQVSTAASPGAHASALAFSGNIGR